MNSTRGLGLHPLLLKEVHPPLRILLTKYWIKTRVAAFIHLVAWHPKQYGLVDTFWIFYFRISIYEKKNIVWIRRKNIADVRNCPISWFRSLSAISVCGFRVSSRWFAVCGIASEVGGVIAPRTAYCFLWRLTWDMEMFSAVGVAWVSLMQYLFCKIELPGVFVRWIKRHPVGNYFWHLHHFL